MSKCTTCRFWHFEVVAPELEPIQECRRYPPRWGIYGSHMKSEWPTAERFDWCGEHQPKDEDAHASGA